MNNFSEWLMKVSLAILAVLSPVKSIMIAAFFLIFMDFITGIWAAGEVAEVALQKNGSLYSTLNYCVAQATHSGLVGLPCSTRQLSLIAGDTLRITVYQNSGAALTLFNSATYNWVSIKRV